MKKCPECGNPSYDGAPICGNCGFKFPKPKVAPPKEESIFDKAPKEKKSSSDESTMKIIKDKKLIIGAILLITIIVICGIVLTASHNNNNNTNSPIQSLDLAEYDQSDFSFKYPNSWEITDGNDTEHEGAVFFDTGNDTEVEFYNSTMSSSSLKEITQQRISFAQGSGSYVELVETVTLDGRNASNMILENADGDYTRYVSMFSDGKLYVFKISGDSINSITSGEIESMINSADIK